MIDWSQIFEELKAEGYTLRRLSIETGIPVTTLHDTKAGHDIGISKGLKIIQLWSDVTGQSIGAFPRNTKEKSSLFGIPNQLP